ncbi:DNA polymerase IV [Marinilabilia rubra]|uniref:DNA polymerase IV n=1 Tax=Marinilabilia rubra TaxID=2162893 RepID=A0A2U2B6R3_9BACT|nr:DNA polymerase IV [Marinilabilia rubra]PWD98745.1 DNA polymerase IV [Marinilabilia rubra]
MTRKIIHIDMDAFFASIEQRDNPSLRGKPVAVGGSSDRGVVAAASYEARVYGVHSAMPSKIAARKCPGLIFVKSRFDVYKADSSKIMEIFRDYTNLVEPLSIDEAFLDVTTNKVGMPSATIIARDIKKRIKEATGLTASAGISVNKFLAKIASDQDKPDGLFVIKPDEVLDFIESLPVTKFFGVGPSTARKMHDLQLFTGGDLRKADFSMLVRNFGKSGIFFHNIANGIDERPVVTHRIRKSVGIENTFSQDLSTRDEMLTELRNLEKGLWDRVKRHGAYGKTLTLKVKYSDFEQITRSHTFSDYVTDPKLVHQAVIDLLNLADMEKPVRLLGISISNFKEKESEGPVQLTIKFD